jgi:hypothetical protein
MSIEYATIKKAVEKFWAAQDKYAAFGAADSEPRYVFYRLIDQALAGKNVTVPVNAELWQLYSDMPGCGKAATALTTATKRVIALIATAKNQTFESYLRSILD